MEWRALAQSAKERIGNALSNVYAKVHANSPDLDTIIPLISSTVVGEITILGSLGVEAISNEVAIIAEFIAPEFSKDIALLPDRYTDLFGIGDFGENEEKEVNGNANQKEATEAIADNLGAGDDLYALRNPSSRRGVHSMSEGREKISRRRGADAIDFNERRRLDLFGVIRSYLLRLSDTTSY